MIELSRYKVSHQNSWDKFVAKSNNGTIFHLRSFLNYHPKSRFKDHSLIVMKNGKIVERGKTKHILRDPKNEYTLSLINAAPKFPNFLHA